MQSNHQLINQTSGLTEWHTPANLIEFARKVMGGIDLDPASTEVANQVVRARCIFTADTNGLAHAWFGRVWLNHPFGRKENPLWINKLVDEYISGRIEQACCITFASTSEQWIQPLMRYPACFISGRVRFIDTSQNRTSPPKGSVIFYLGQRVLTFSQYGQMFGNVMIPAHLAYREAL